MKTDMGTTGDHQMSIFPHKNDPWSPWSPVVPEIGDRGPRVSPPKGGPQGSRRDQLTKKFTANTCPRCHHITVAGQWVGLRVDLEPQVLTDLDEVTAIAAGVRTWNLHPDRTAEPRTVAHIAAATSRGTRHARHTCGTTYGSAPLPPPRPTYVMPDEPAF